ncbi:MAG: tRNA pseudouridine(55) synthase TruB [Lachnospiraceae bacterium]|nr:tRNA pseudouridine(55) synthase TruB [Lachnospiraceae bacterium]
MDGILNIYKECDFTSHDVVAKMRGILKQKKIGHTGTLDPQATGVLPVCVGAATKLCDMFTDKSKTYKAVMLLGIATDTEDMTGSVTATDEEWKNLDSEAVLEAVKSFVGRYMQVPPMYSALKVNGRKLYDYARAGVEVERQPREVYIYSIEDIEINLPRVSMSVSCSKGTYIRTLCVDIGKRLGVSACMENLKRIRVGSFDIYNSITLGELENIVADGKIDDYLLPVDAVFSGMDRGVCPEIYAKYLYNGNKLDVAWISVEKSVSKDYYNWAENMPGCIRIYSESGRFIGIYRQDTEAEQFVPHKLFFI